MLSEWKYLCLNSYIYIFMYVNYYYRYILAIKNLRYATMSLPTHSGDAHKNSFDDPFLN